MDLPIYSPKTTAELLGISPKSLRSALAQDKYTARDLWALRKALRIHPRPLGHRKQLFLNFKGGTGKTSLSTSYAYRLSELGYSVLLVDLDSQGHATKCLGTFGFGEGCDKDAPVTKEEHEAHKADKKQALAAVEERTSKRRCSTCWCARRRCPRPSSTRRCPTWISCPATWG